LPLSVCLSCLSLCVSCLSLCVSCLMAQILETILTSLLQPDNAIIQQATAQLKEAFKDPLIIPALCEVLRGSQDPQVYTALLYICIHSIVL
ncbi:hypothetical protein FKM82_024850, partial [Ascaphus truei]